MKLNSTNKKNFKNVWDHYFKKQDAFLVPNLLCYLRIILIGGFVALYLIPFSLCGNKLAHIYLAAGTLMIAAYSDFIDGYIARTFNMQSELGKVLDPIADKLLQFAIATVILVNYYDSILVVMMFVVFIGKEVTLFFEDLFLATKRNTSYGGAKWYGKVSSFVFYIVTIFILLGLPIIIEHDAQNSAGYVDLIVDICCGTAIACLSLAWICYFILFVKIMKKPPVKLEEKEENGND